ncbi:copper transport protein ATOX1 homolog [Mizuhopecten yessoensis]|uniref:copper transport protein ATOX1 homolog n=1 Tax=Mizuhopecten yessoensis TaxID=6573 RepID=UPI000B45CA94|nr:copper transport protein ATOX1 homolog [Mizuhopecten yessoensis]
MAGVKTHTFFVDMTCGGCSGAAIRVLTKDNLVDKGNIEIDLDKKTVVVKSELEAKELEDVLKKTGKDVKFISTA